MGSSCPFWRRGRPRTTALVLTRICDLRSHPHSLTPHAVSPNPPCPPPAHARHVFEEGGNEPGDGDVDGDDDDDDDDEEAVLGLWGSIFWLGVITVFISFLSEFMVDALQGASENWGVPDLFLGTIVIPIVGNAAEHAAAIIFAVKNKMELSLGIAIGSSTQIALFVVPLCIVIGWCVDEPLSLDFHPFETGTLLLTVLLVGFLIQNGESNWLMGLMLVIAYCVVSAGYFVHTDAPGQLETTIVGTEL